MKNTSTRKLILPILLSIFTLSLKAQTGNYQTLNLNNSGSGASLLKFNTERSWEFKQVDTGPSSKLQLHNTTGTNKDFQIKTDGALQLLNQSNSLYARFSANGGNSYVGRHGGNFGIGTHTPSNPLHVVRQTGGNVAWFESLNGDANIKIKTEGTTTFKSTIDFGDASHNHVGSITYNHNLDVLTFDTNNSSWMTLDDHGKLGIGTNTPASKLHIASDTYKDFIALDRRARPEVDHIFYMTPSWDNDQNDQLRIVVNNIGLATFEETGRVGIGTTNPGAQLDVVGGALWVSNSDNQRLELQQDNNANAIINNRAQGGDMKFQMTGADKMIIKRNGRVGIGTTTPGTELDVIGTVQSDYIKVNAVTSSEGGELRLDGPSGFNEWKIDNFQGSLRLHHSGSTFFQVSSGGNVGIGTSSTGSHKLAVDGSIGARKIQVEASGWSDFVFENDYELRTLQEVEKHITENGHLPEIPSEQEVLEDGINLGEMDAKLLQKIEELTLYLIDQNKRMNRLEAKNEELQKEITHLKGK